MVDYPKMGDRAILKHKGLGIASFVVCVVGSILIVLLTGTAGVLKVSGMETKATDVIIGLSFFLFSFVELVGIGLGIAGAVDKTSKKVFPVLGIVIGTSTIVIGVAMIVVGLSRKS